MNKVPISWTSKEMSIVDQVENIINELPTCDYAGCQSLEKLYLYQGFWYLKSDLTGVIICQQSQSINPKDNQVILATFPKSGTTWFKALIYSIINRDSPDLEDTLKRSSPHDFAKWVEYYAYKHPENPMPKHDVHILSTHMPFDAFPLSFLNSQCPIVYVSRDPKDNFISLWHFLNKMKPNNSPAVELISSFTSFCQGVSHYGPFWDHALSFWRPCLIFPQKVFFIRYEDMKLKPREHIKKLAEFIGYPFSDMEVKEGCIDRINRLCSFENLSAVSGNRSKDTKMITPALSVSNHMFFRKGQVGDHVNYLTPSMIQVVDKIIQEKLQQSGLNL